MVGALIASVGLVLVLDLISGADLSTTGVLWALGAMVGAATYFVIGADTDNGLPPITLAASGLVVLAVALVGQKISVASRRWLVRASGVALVIFGVLTLVRGQPAVHHWMHEHLMWGDGGAAGGGHEHHGHDGHSHHDH